MKRSINQNLGENMHIDYHLHPYTHNCPHYIDHNGSEEEKSVTIVPVKTNIMEDGSLTITWGCSFSKRCYNVQCRYSKANRQYEKAKSKRSKRKTQQTWTP